MEENARFLWRGYFSLKNKEDIMITWNNLDTLDSYKELSKASRVNLAEVMSGENGAERVKNYSIPMAEGFSYNYAAKAVDDDVLDALVKLAKEAQLAEKFKALYNGEVVNTGEKRLVLHHMTRGQLGDAVNADGVDKRAFYVEQQNRIADFANKVHAGEITNAAGEKFTTVVQIGIGGSPRAMYLALENWAKKNNTFKMEAKFISNVDPDDAAAVLNSIDVAHSIFVLVSKSGTTLETLTNESFVKDALKKAGLDASKHMIAVTSETSPLAKSDDYLAAFFMDDYIGGRFSSTSAVGGAVLSLAFGPEVFAQFLEGAAAEDKLSANEDVLKNPEMLDALIGVYERNVLGYPCTAVLPYSQALNRFPAHLQQLDMESNGKSVNRFGEPVSYPTGPVIFGEPGTNGQHSFYQLLHQGTDIVPLQFVGFKNNQIGTDVVIQDSTSQQKLCANVAAQIVAFACGKSDENRNKNFEGGRPSSIIIGDQVNPGSLGALLAHFENKIMFQGFLWNVNSFDQEGVQLGKVLAKRVLAHETDGALKVFSDLLNI
jgi:glucose-6-phosphate isomerase